MEIARHECCKPKWLSRPENLAALTDLSGQWIDKVHTRRPPKTVVLDMDSSKSPTYGEQEGSAYNGHFGCTCYHRLFVFNQLGDVERCALRPGNMHSADGWRAVLDPVVSRCRGTVKRLYFRGDAAFANPAAISQSSTYSPRNTQTCFLPLKSASTRMSDRFYINSGFLGAYSNSQLLCYGFVQFYRNSSCRARATVEMAQNHSGVSRLRRRPVPGVCLNNLTRRSWLSWLLKVRWLPKPYAWLPWWIYAKPVICHRDPPGVGHGFRAIADPKGRKEFYPSLMK
jgi:hypothetical protein